MKRLLGLTALLVACATPPAPRPAPAAAAPPTCQLPGCGGWDGAKLGACPAGLLQARVVEVSEEASGLGGSHLFLEATIDGRKKRLHAGDHGWRTRLDVGATVTVNAAILPAPIRWSNPWTAEHEIDGFAIIVSPANAFDPH